MEEIQKIYLSWEDVHNHTKQLCGIIAKNHTNIKGIVTVTRGGLVPCAIVASELNIRNIETIAIASYSDDYNVEALKVLSLPHNAVQDQGEGWIIIDELVDRGTTAKYIKDLLPKGHFYAVTTKIEAPYLSAYIVKYPKNSWIYFPWEIN